MGKLHKLRRQIIRDVKLMQNSNWVSASGANYTKKSSVHFTPINRWWYSSRSYNKFIKKVVQEIFPVD